MKMEIYLIKKKVLFFKKILDFFFFPVAKIEMIDVYFRVDAVLVGEVIGESGSD